MTALIDTNILVYRFDPRDPEKQEEATACLRRLIGSGEAVLAHQCLVEFVAAVSRPVSEFEGEPLLSPQETVWEAEELFRQFPVIYPTEHSVRLALLGWRGYQLSWFDAHLWSTAEAHGIGTLYSEDFQHQRVYGTVRVVDPFQDGE